jgi:hypothetical protein
VRAPPDDLFRASVATAVASARASAAFGPGGVARDVLEEAIAAATTDGCVFVALDSSAARHRMLAVVDDADGGLRSAPVLVVACAEDADGTVERTILLRAGAAIRSLAVALHGLGLAWSWDPARALDADRALAALSLAPHLRPVGLIGVGPAPGGGAERPAP